MDSIDEMDMILMQQHSHDKENDILGLDKIAKSFSYSPRQLQHPHPSPRFQASPRMHHETPSQSRGHLQQPSLHGQQQQVQMHQTSSQRNSQDSRHGRSTAAAAGAASRPATDARASSSLQFHLVTNDKHGGYVVSVSQNRVSHFRRILTDSGFYKIDCETATRQILAKAKPNIKGRYTLTKPNFDLAMRTLVPNRSMSIDTQNQLSDLLNEIFKAFEEGNTGCANAVELACGFTVLCHGKKSDKLEYAFELMDSTKKGMLSQKGTLRYLWSFLAVLLSITSSNVFESDPIEDSMVTMNGELCDVDPKATRRVVDAGSSWASSQAFSSSRNQQDVICFDEFAEWYTQVGFSNIPWIELLDLKKWALLDS